MAKPRNPKKTKEVKEVVAPVTTSTPAAGLTQAEATSPAIAATEVKAEAKVKTETKKPEPRKTAPKPAIVKTESRKNLVPINLDDEIRRFAYLLSERRGFEPGHESEDWLTAEREVRQRYHQHSA